MDIRKYNRELSKIREHKYPVRIALPDTGFKIAGPECLPAEELMNFDISKFTGKEKFTNLTQLFARLFSDLRSPVPMGAEIGAACIGPGYELGTAMNGGTLIRKFKDKFKIFFDVNITPAEISPGKNYIQCPVEELSNVFVEGRRSNFFYLSRVLTADNLAADIETEEQRAHIFSELNKATLPGGVIVINNGNEGTNFSDEELTRTGFVSVPVHFGYGEEIFLLYKPLDVKK